MMKRILIFAYGIFCYGVFLAAFLYMMGFLSNMLAPRSVDSGTNVSLAVALPINLALIVLFGLPHSVMARGRFKQWWTRLIPAVAERSTYVLVSTLTLVLLMWQWQPMTTSLWTVGYPPLRMLIWGLYWGGHGVVLLASFLINHFELFGLQQSYLQLRQRETSAPDFQTPLLYRVVRHPLQLGLLIVFWATPDMTTGHLLLALGMTSYMLVGLYFEERDLTTHFGDAYRQYQQTTPKLLPTFMSRPNV
jgi:methanethiol S-methyltransferase